MAKTDIQPLDLILFRGVDPVSDAIGFFERLKDGRGDYSHSGVVVTADVLDLPFLEPGRRYVWESTLTAAEGFWAKFTDRIPDEEGDNVRFGVQLRDLELVVPAYESSGGKVAWSRFTSERAAAEELRPQLRQLYDEYGHAVYDPDLVDLFGVIFPAFRALRNVRDTAKDRVTHGIDTLLERAHAHRRPKGVTPHLFCSEWVALVYKRLGLLDVPDPRNAAPVDFLTKPDPALFEEPVPL